MTVKRFEQMSRKKRNGIKYLLMVSPFLIFVFAFSYVPLFGWLYAFFDYKVGAKLTDCAFVGLRNFSKLFHDRDTFRVLRNTLVMGFLNILFSPVPVFFAILLNDIKVTKVKKFVQTITTLPHFISWIAVFGLSFVLFSSSGMVNQLLDILHIPHSAFGLLGNGEHVWAFQMALSIWKSLGWSTIIYMAAIAGIDMELYDAARVDGANKIQLIRHITIPGLVSTYLVLLLLSVSNLLNIGFEQYYMFWNSLVSDKIEVLDYYVYKLSFLSSQYSYAIAIGIMKTFVSITLLLTANQISKKLRGDSLV